MRLPVPNSFGTGPGLPVSIFVSLYEDNKCHLPTGAPSSSGGEFAKKGEGNCKGGGTGGSSSERTRVLDRRSRPKVRQVADIDEAVEAIINGEVVEVPSVKKVNTILSKLAEIAQEAKRLRVDAPTYDLCKVSVPRTNLFCESRVVTDEHPEGIPRINMPQFTGMPRPGSRADKLPKDPKTGEIDASQAFIRHLTTLGIHVEDGSIPASRLKASQAELDGPKVAGMMTAPTSGPKKYDPGEKPIFVSRDAYVIDGHHRWAAVVGRDAGDTRLGDLRMNTQKVNAPISDILKIANAWAIEFGILPKKAKADSTGKKKLTGRDYLALLKKKSA